jgi:hypothetical protein
MEIRDERGSVFSVKQKNVCSPLCLWVALSYISIASSI